jgi:histidinol-phosphatase (PHP family)
MAEMAKAAVDANFDHWGFSPHSPINVKSSCNMAADDVTTYLAEVSRLKALYGDTIRLYASMEIDYMSPQWGPSIEQFQAYSLDYRIGSVHFVPTRDGRWIDCDGNFTRFRANLRDNFNDDIRYVVETFFTQSLKMVELGGFDIIGHADKIAHNASQFAPDIEEQPWYIALSNQLVDAIADKGLVAEINTKALPEYGRIFPSPRLIKRLIDRGVTLIVNSDAHYADRVDYGRSEGLAILSKIARHS